MASIFVIADDKHIPLYRVMWVSDIPHFCGHEDCQREGQYEIRLEQDESIWASRADRDNVLKAVDEWHAGGPEAGDDWE